MIYDRRAYRRQLAGFYLEFLAQRRAPSLAKARAALPLEELLFRKPVLDRSCRSQRAEGTVRRRPEISAILLPLTSCTVHVDLNRSAPLPTTRCSSQQSADNVGATGHASQALMQGARYVNFRRCRSTRAPIRSRAFSRDSASSWLDTVRGRACCRSTPRVAKARHQRMSAQRIGRWSPFMNA